MKFATLALAGMLAVAYAGSASAGSCCAAKKADAVEKKAGNCPATAVKDCGTTGSAKLTASADVKK